jgi:hypothetical protein
LADRQKGAAVIGHGLEVRESVHRDEAPNGYRDQVAPGRPWEQITAGMDWERMIRVSQRHPVDCLHSWVAFGPLAEGESRMLHGKIYLLQGEKKSCSVPGPKISPPAALDLPLCCP